MNKPLSRLTLFFVYTNYYNTKMRIMKRYLEAKQKNPQKKNALKLKMMKSMKLERVALTFLLNPNFFILVNAGGWV